MAYIFAGVDANWMHHYKWIYFNKFNGIRSMENEMHMFVHDQKCSTPWIATIDRPCLDANAFAVMEFCHTTCDNGKRGSFFFWRWMDVVKICLTRLKSVFNYGKCEINKLEHVALNGIYYLKWYKFTFNAWHTYACWSHLLPPRKVGILLYCYGFYFFAVNVAVVNFHIRYTTYSYYLLFVVSHF